MQHPGDTVIDWIFLSKNGNDEYINHFAHGCGSTITNTDDFRYEDSDAPVVLRGILKHKIMHRCWQDGRTFYYMDTGYFGNMPSRQNPQGWKLWHRVVRNDLQHSEILPRPDDRWRRHSISLHPRRHGSRIIIAAPDEKPCRFYGINRDTWLDSTLQKLKTITDRPISVRERVPNRAHRTRTDPLAVQLVSDTHALVTFNSAAAIESIMLGVPAFVLSPTHAASPVANRALENIDDPHWPDEDKLYAWACHLAYGQFHVDELKNGTAARILNED